MTPFKGRNRVTSLYGWRVLRGVRQWHPGLDIVGDDSGKVRAIWAGRCEIVMGWNGGRGNSVYLYFSATLRVICQHLAAIYVKQGQNVPQGYDLGLMGNSGDSLGAHLHIEVQKKTGGRWVAIDPSPFVEVPNVAKTHAGNDKLDGVQEPAYKAPQNTVVLAVGPMSAGDRLTLEREAARLALGCGVQQSGGNLTTLLIGPMTPGDRAAVEAKAKALVLPCKVWTGSVSLQIGPASAGDVTAVNKKAGELGATAKAQDAGRGEKVLTVVIDTAQMQVMEAFAASLALPVGVA